MFEKTVDKAFHFLNNGMWCQHLMYVNGYQGKWAKYSVDVGASTSHILQRSCD